MKPVEGQGAVPAAGAVERAEHVWRAGAEAQLAGQQAAEEARRRRGERAVARPPRAETGTLDHAGDETRRRPQERARSSGAPRGERGTRSPEDGEPHLDLRLD